MNEKHQQKRPSCLGVLAAIGTILGIFLAILTALTNFVSLLLQLPKHFVIQISGFQISIGITFLIALLILALMGLSFAFGVLYSPYGVITLFTTKLKPPLFLRPFVVLASPFFYFTNWLSKQWYRASRKKHPPSELQIRLSLSLKDQKENFEVVQEE